MNLFYFSLIFAISLVWGIHFSVVKFATDVFDPLFYAAIRMTIVWILLLPFARWHKTQMKKIFFASLCFGFINYFCLFIGIKYSTPSTAGITIELATPFALILSVFFLHEKVGLIRWLAVLVAFVGVGIISLNGDDFKLSFGLLLIAIAALTEAMGSVTLRKIKKTHPFQLLFWFALNGSIFLWISTLLIEKPQFDIVFEHTKLLVLTAGYSALLASIFGHSIYYFLIQRLGVSAVSPYLLMTSLFATIFAVIIYGDEVTIHLVIGGAMTILGVLILLLRTGKKQKIPIVPPSADVVKVEINDKQ